MIKVRIKVHSEDARVTVSQVHRPLCMIVQEGDLLQKPTISKLGIEKPAEPQKILAAIGIYVDDYLAARLRWSKNVCLT